MPQREPDGMWEYLDSNVVQEEVGLTRFEQGRFSEAAKLMSELTTSTELTDFLTIPGYTYLD